MSAYKIQTPGNYPEERIKQILVFVLLDSEYAMTLDTVLFLRHKVVLIDILSGQFTYSLWTGTC